MTKPNIELLNLDCLPFMKQCSDKKFDLAIVDPPYGIERFKNGIGKNDIHKTKTKNALWNNNTPTKEYFDELKRISKNQIIWGANYHNCFFDKGGALVWFKDVRVDNFSKAELAYQSFTSIVDYYRYDWTNTDRYNLKVETIHPTQKPVSLYEFCLMNYAKKGDNILDTHLGSGSIALACHNLGYNLTGIEIDKEYFEKASKRIDYHKRQLTLF